MDSQQYCLNKIYLSLLDDLRQTESLVDSRLQPIQQTLWKQFAELIGTDSLNTHGQQQFLAMKNKVILKLTDSEESNLSITKAPTGTINTQRLDGQFQLNPTQTFTHQLQEAFADLIPNRHAKSHNKLLALSLSDVSKKKLNQRPTQTISQQLQGMRDTKLRNQIFEKIERDALSRNRLEHELSPTEIRKITSARREEVNAVIDTRTMQLHAPGTNNHLRLLNNSYVSEVDIDSAAEIIDLEMALNLCQVSNPNKPGPKFTNMNCQYDFRPTNFNFIMLSRLSFAPNKKRIQKLIHKKIMDKRKHLKVAHELLEEKERNTEIERERTSTQNFKSIEEAYPKLFKDKIAPHLKKQQQLEQDNFNFNRQDSSNQYTYVPGQLFPSSYKPASGQGLSNYANEIPDDIQRARANHFTFPQPKINIYTKEPSTVQLIPRFKLIQDPFAYEMEYKRQNVWCVKDIKIFINNILRYTKCMEKVGEALPHKSAKEIVFFYHTFKKLVNLKTQIKNCREVQKLRATPVPESSILSQTEEILQPLTDYVRKQKLEIISGDFITPATPLNLRLNENQVRHSHQMQRSMFNIEELIQIFTMNSQNIRRRPKQIYPNAQDSLSTQYSSRSLFPLNTFPLRPEYLGCPAITKNVFDLIEHQQPYESEEDLGQYGQIFDQRQNFGSSSILGKRLQKIDYVEYLEKSGLDTLNYLQLHRKRVNQLSHQLRTALTASVDPLYSNLENDSYRYVICQKPQQQIAAVCNDDPIKKTNIQKETRNHREHIVFNFVLPKQDKPQSSVMKRKPQNQMGFTQQYFSQLEARSKEKDEQHEVAQVKQLEVPDIAKQVKSEKLPRKFSEMKKADPQFALSNKTSTQNIKSNQSTSQKVDPEISQQDTEIKEITPVLKSTISVKQDESDEDSKSQDEEEISNNRKLRQQDQSNDPSRPIRNSNSNTRVNGFNNNPWQTDEKEQFIELLKKHGKNFGQISTELGSRTSEQCRNYFQNYKVKLSLNQYLNE